jgi:hypothetical protein
MKYLFAFVLSINCLFAFSQNKVFVDLYENREYEKLVKKTDAQLTKDPSDLYAYYYKSLGLYEMAILPEKYIPASNTAADNPLEQYLQTLSKLRKNDDNGSFMKEHKDTIKLMKQYAESIAKETVAKNKLKAIHLYKLIYKISTDDFNSLITAEIYLKADDINSAYLEIDHVYGFDKSNGTDKALTEAPMFMMKNWMFKDLFEIAQKYAHKYPQESDIGQAFYKGIKESIDTMYDYKDKEMFFEYCEKAVKLYPSTEDLRSYLIKKFMSLMKKSVIEYDKIATTKTWRDTLLLRNVFKYTALANRVIPDSQFVRYESKIEDKYLITIPYDRIAMLRDICRDVVNKARTIACKCRDKDFSETDTLAWSQTLEVVAREHAKDMFAFNYTDTKDKSGKEPKDRVDQTDLKAYKLNTFAGIMFSGAIKVDECESSGYSMINVQNALDLKELVQSVVNKWLASKDGDCEKLKDYEFNTFGMATFGDRWVLTLAKVITIQDK